MRKVLTIAFDFPPRRTSGVYRPTGMVKHLVKLGWLPTVLTVRPLRGCLEDASLLQRIPNEVRTVRTGYLNLSGWEEPAGHGLRATGHLRPKVSGESQSRRDRFLRGAGELVRSCLYFPDETVGWVPFGFVKAIQLSMQQPFDVVYTTSPPRSSLVIGLLVKLFLRRPWVAEFRDPWYPPARPWRRSFEASLQAAILRRADSVVVTAEGHKEELKRAFHVHDNKLVVIRNGFEESDFENLEDEPADFFERGYLHLSHFGTVYSGSSGTFFHALGELVKECPEIRRFLRVNIVGYPDDTVRRHAEEGELREIIRLHAFLPHQRVLSAMRSSGCLLLFLGKRDLSRLAVAGKAYEYMRVGRPILAITYEGDLKQLVEQGHAGWAVHPDDKERIKQVLRTFIRNHQDHRGNATADPEFVAQFRYEVLAAKLASVFEEVATDGR